MLWQRNGSGNSREQRRRACRRSNVPAVVDPYGPFGSVAGAISADSLSPTIAEPDPLTPFYVGFTSGSTGAPKGYPRHYQSWIESFRAGDRGFDIGTDDVVLAPVALMQSLFLYPRRIGDVRVEYVESRRERSARLSLEDICCHLNLCARTARNAAHATINRT